MASGTRWKKQAIKRKARLQGDRLMHLVLLTEALPSAAETATWGQDATRIVGQCQA